MKFEVAGKIYNSFLSATATVQVDSLANTFSFAAGVGSTGKLPFGMGDECVVYVDGQRIITGHVEVLSGSGSKSSNTIDITGRDKPGDIVDSNIGSLSDLKAPITLKKTVELVIAHIGADIDVVDLVGASFDKQSDIVAPETGDNAFEYLEKSARTLNCILSSNDEGNVVIQRSAGVVVNAHLVNRTNGTANNILEYQFNYDFTGRFFKYQSLSNSNLGLIGLLGDKTPNAIVNQQGFVTDRLVREGRQYVISSENPGTSASQTERAMWEANIRIARSRTYNATVSGFRNQSGDIWTPNTIVKVVDDNAEIDDSLLINSVTYRMGHESGRTTSLSCVNKNAYTLLTEEPKEQKSEGSLEAALFGAGNT